MSLSKPILVVTEWPLRDGWEQDFISRILLREGISANQVAWISLLHERPYAGIFARASAEQIERGRTHVRASLLTSRPNVILAMGAAVSEFLTGKSGIDKWQCSVLTTLTDVGHACKVIPCYPATRVAQDLSLQLWVSICARKIKQEMLSPALTRSPRVLLRNPSLEETLHLLSTTVAHAERLSVDIETGRGQINTLGFATGPDWGVAIGTLPDRCGISGYRELWQALAMVLESDQPKILQNFIYETTYLARYGIRLRNVQHDTMICQKFLWPDFEMGLDAVGRMYSEMPYWKDDGKSWNNIRDWEAHYGYNCKDTTGTFEGYLGQRKDLEARGLDRLHDGYLTRLFEPIAEMCTWGLPVSRERLLRLRAEVGGEYDAALQSLREMDGAEKLNPRSPMQLKSFLSSAPRKYSIPKKYNSAEKKYQESTDEKSLKKLRLKYPQDEALPLLLKISKLGKAQSAYLSMTYDEVTSRMNFMLNGHGTETGRFSGSKDPWGHGVNPQTIPGGSKGINIKQIFEAEPGFVLFQCDLAQAESRFVAYDAADANLIAALEDRTRDIHSEVATEICRALGRDPETERADTANWKKKWRQLGKKSGHGANYSMKEATFMDTVLSEMELVLSKTEATKVLEAYHTLFPGIRQWHANIRKELAQNRCLRTPLGRVRQCWGRLDDDTFRQFYAYRPQSTVPDIVNHLMLHLVESRRLGSFDFRLLLQCHDSLLLEVPEVWVGKIARECFATEHWHPKVMLPGGRLIIPVDVEVGQNYGELSKWRGSEEAARKEVRHETRSIAAAR